MAILTHDDDAESICLHSPVALPQASGFLWNKKMMLQVNCQGYVVAQFMQPEPAKYAHAPNLEAATFMQPEQPYYAHHPGRFFYVKDEETGEIFSAPYAPVKTLPDAFRFSQKKAEIRWQINVMGLQLDICVNLTKDDVVELWEVVLTNKDKRQRNISLYPYFPFGYMSWMNQGAEYRPEFQGIVARSVTPYQKVEQYEQHKNFKDLSFLLSSEKPDAWEANQAVFEGEGGVHHPSSLDAEYLNRGDACYETPTAVLQYRRCLAPDEKFCARFLFGPAKDDEGIKRLRNRYFKGGKAVFDNAKAAYHRYIDSGLGRLKIVSPDKALNHFVNTWLPRQMFYHGDVNRLTTDPQTRNFLQDNMGMAYIQPDVSRAAFVRAIRQQHNNGSMPDGILLIEGAQLKYINQVPHTDHCVWLPMCLQAYLDETNDYGLLDERLPYVDSDRLSTVYEHINEAMAWLVHHRDGRGLAYIEQGDWCDPMNMVGYKGRGVSGWLTIATVYALNTWAKIVSDLGRESDASGFFEQAETISECVQEHLWDGAWFARGITDDNKKFGVKDDTEGRIFLNPQSFALLAGIPDKAQKESMLQAIEQQLETPYGVMMLAPAYTHMREDIGRVTQKFPGSAENGSVYNHAAAFYIYSLFQCNEPERAFRLMRAMLPGPEETDYCQRGQMPAFIPNYYRGAYYQLPRTAGRSSQLFNTGTVHWFYRSLIDGLLGLRGDKNGLHFKPEMPDAWPELRVYRQFRGADFNIHIIRSAVTAPVLIVDGGIQPDTHFSDIQFGQQYQAILKIPLKN